MSVVVTANKLNLVVIPGNNPEYGYIRVEESRMTFSNGWAKPQTRSALIRGKVEDLKLLGFTKGKILPGQIFITESFTAPNPNDAQQDIKLSGAGGIPCSVEDQPIYRTAEYTTDMTKVDTLIDHDNSDAIKAAQKASKTVGQKSHQESDVELVP